MAGIHDLANLNAVQKLAGAKYIVYTSVQDDELVIGATDGVKVWQSALGAVQKDDNDKYKQILSAIRNAFREMKLQWLGPNLEVTSDKLTSPCALDASSDEDARIEIQKLLFHYAEKCLDHQTSAGSSTKTEDVGGTTSPSKRPGMSILNPASKKRKAPKGVVYD